MPIEAVNGEALISVEKLSFTYPSAAQQTLSALDFEVRRGGVYGFLGPSGAGKSTTQKILYGLLGGYSGAVRIAGKEIREWGATFYTLTGIGFETPNLYLKLTGRENLEFALALHESAHSESTRSSSPHSLPPHSFPDADESGTGSRPRVSAAEIEAAATRLGLDDALDTRVETWSKGMRMRLSFIRAVIHQPLLLFLDEPTSGLDPMWARRVKDWIIELREAGAAVFLTTHSMELADELCDTVGFLVDGSIVAEDAPATLKQRFGRPGITVRGFGPDGAPREADIEYDELLKRPVEGFTDITRITNREVSLEQVFLQLTGRSLLEGA